MCKVLMLSNAKKLGIRDLKKFLKIAAPIITAADDDGFGWASYANGKLFGERYLDPDAFDFRIESSLRVNLPVVKNTSVSFGTLAAPDGPLLVHGRTSTNAISLQNTHPFVRKNWALIHNGVVQNKGPEYAQKSTCDTEHLIHYLTSEGITGIEKNISGYYAIGAIDPDGQLHVIKESTAKLSVTYVKNIDSFMFGTTAELLTAIAKGMKWSIAPIETCEDNFHLVLGGSRVLLHRTITPLKFDFAWDADAKKSLNYMADYDTMEDSYSTEYGNLEEDIDDTYDIWDADGTELALDDYKRLPLYRRLACTIVRPDGTWVRASSKATRGLGDS